MRGKSQSEITEWMDGYLIAIAGERTGDRPKLYVGV